MTKIKELKLDFENVNCQNILKNIHLNSTPTEKHLKYSMSHQHFDKSKNKQSKGKLIAQSYTTLIEMDKEIALIQYAG